MHQRPRKAMAALVAADIPDEPGVYALYRKGRPIYVGLAAKRTLRERLWGNHRGRGKSMTGSALRRNVAESLGIASSADIKARRYKPTGSDAARAVAWSDGCEVTWQACGTPEEAVGLEDDMKQEWKPLLTKR